MRTLTLLPEGEGAPGFLLLFLQPLLMPVSLIAKYGFAPTDFFLNICVKFVNFFVVLLTSYRARLRTFSTSFYKKRNVYDLLTSSGKVPTALLSLSLHLDPGRSKAEEKQKVR